MIGVPVSYNLAFIQTDNVGPMDGDILIALKPDHHPTAGYMRQIRQMLAREFPGLDAYFQPADLVSQVLNFGLAAPIDIQLRAPDIRNGYEGARHLRDASRRSPARRTSSSSRCSTTPPSTSTSTGCAPRSWASASATSRAACFLADTGRPGRAQFLPQSPEQRQLLRRRQDAAAQLDSVSSVMATPSCPAGRRRRPRGPLGPPRGADEDPEHHRRHPPRRRPGLDQATAPSSASSTSARTSRAATSAPSPRHPDENRGARTAAQGDGITVRGRRTRS